MRYDDLLDLVDRALLEDVGSGDVTSEATVPADARAVATIVQKAPGVVSGLDAAEAVFRRLDPSCSIERGPEGEWRAAGAPVLRVEGHARALLTGERTALNFLQRLSGVATITASVVRAVQDAGGGATILDTRKTTPGLRGLEKAAVVDGGGTNHRTGLFDAILIKENHAALGGGVAAAVRSAQAARPDLPVEVEVRDVTEIDAALEAGADRLLLDNMAPDQVRAAVERVARAGLAGGVGGDHAGHSCGLCDNKGARLRLARVADPLRPGARPLPRPGAAPLMTLLELENTIALQEEVRALAAERNAVILAHNYELPEIQGVADYVGDSLGLSQQAARTPADVIAFCGVHFMAETASILSPEKTVLLPDLGAGCSLADSITADQLRAWKAKHPGAIVVMYVNTTAEVKAETDYCVTSANAVRVVEHIYARARRRTPRSSSAPTCSWAPSWRSRTRPARCTCGTASATCTPASGPATSTGCATRIRAPTSSSTPSAGARRRSWSTSRPATSAPRASTCSPRAGCSTTPSGPRPAARRSSRRRPACCTRSRRRRRASRSCPPTGRRSAST